MLKFSINQSRWGSPPTPSPRYCSKKINFSKQIMFIENRYFYSVALACRPCFFNLGSWYIAAYVRNQDSKTGPLSFSQCIDTSQLHYSSFSLKQIQTSNFSPRIVAIRSITEHKQRPEAYIYSHAQPYITNFRYSMAYECKCTHRLGIFPYASNVSEIARPAYQQHGRRQN